MSLVNADTGEIYMQSDNFDLLVVVAGFIKRSSKEYINIWIIQQVKVWE